MKALIVPYPGAQIAHLACTEGPPARKFLQVHVADGQAVLLVEVIGDLA